MSNTTNVQAIITNIETILSDTLGFELEDLSVDPDVDSSPACQLFYQSEDFQDPFKQLNRSSTIGFLIRFQVSREQPHLLRDVIQDWHKQIRAAITTDTLNVGDLSSNLAVSWVKHDANQYDYQMPVGVGNHNFSVRYKEGV